MTWRTFVICTLLLSVACTRTSTPRAPRHLTAPSSQAVATGSRGAVSSAEQNASDVGRALLARGGNAVDAAVAVAFALNVTHPSAGNIGGGGFMLIRLPRGEAIAIDYREVAPFAAQRDMFLGPSGEVLPDAQRGPRAAGVPGVVAGLAAAHAKFGKLPWAALIEPAIALARDGHVLDAFHAEELHDALAHVSAFHGEVVQAYRREPTAALRALQFALEATRATFGKQDGRAYRAGEVWRQPELAETLALIARSGADVFYRGRFAQHMAEQVSAMGGIWSARDLAEYRAVEREPIRFSYRGHTVLTMPPPSAGGVVLRQMLAASELLKLHELPWESTQRVHLFVEIARRAYADRNQLLGDPAFVDMPLAQLLSADYAGTRMASIDRAHATPSAAISAGLPVAEPLHTTHFSVVDGSGMAVANTFTLNTNFGALLQIPGTGVTLNNEMDDFTAKPGAPNAFGLVQGTRNAIEPGKRMLSSMTPTILEQAGVLRAVLGSPGGPTITTTVAQVLLQLVDHGVPLEQAIQAPRVHHQWLPDSILFEPGVPAQVRGELRAMGHRLEQDPAIGHANCIEVAPGTQTLRAVADVTRGGGGAAAF